MDDFDSPGYTEFFYEKRAEGKLRVMKSLLVFGYILFVLAFFLVCYATRFIPIFAICPLLTWILVYFTWRIVSYDVYYTFDRGHMEIGKLKKRKKAVMRTPYVKLEAKSAVLVMPYERAVETDEYRSVRRVRDFSSTLSSAASIVIIYTDEQGNEAVVLESTPKLLKLLKEYSPGL